MNAALWMAWSLMPLACGQAAQEPYAAVVVQETQARCGPGAHYYATNPLAAGQRIEVYRSEANWLAIRPPRGSFSWVPARQLRTTELDDVAVATTDQVRVWIGTPLVELNKHHFQVELRKGEPVEILGEKQLVTPAGDVADRWFKIAPPAGEFRWVERAAVRRDDGQGNNVPGEPLATSPARPLSEPAEIERISGLREPRPLTLPAAASEPSEDAAPVKQARRPEWLSWQPPTDAAEFERVLEKMQTDFAAIAALPSSQWRFDELRIKAGKMAEQGPSPLQRGKARKLLANVEEFQRLAARIRSRAAAPRTGETDNQGAEAEGEVDFDGQGWLMPVHSKKKSVPPFVLVDDNGRFLKFVSPDGVNLRPYEKTKVGLIGPKSYLPSLDMPHVTAQRVVKLR